MFANIPELRSVFEGIMNQDQPGRRDPDPNETVRRRFPHPEQPPRPSPRPEDPPSTQRLPFTPDMLPDVPHVEAKPPKSAWWWVIVAGGLVLLIAALAVAAILWIRSSAGGAPSGTPRALENVTPAPNP
jgi:hypothetical protein